MIPVGCIIVTMTVAAASVGSAVVAGIAFSFALFHFGAALSVRSYRWGLWAGGLSVATGVFAAAVYAQYNVTSPAAQIAAERVQYTAIVWIPVLVAGFERGVLGDRLGRLARVAAVVAAVLTGAVWVSPGVVTPQLVTRTFRFFDTTYVEPAIGPVGRLVLAYSGLLAVYIVGRFVRRRTQGFPGRRILQIGAVVWLLAALNDIAGTLGAQVPHFFLEYGFLAFLIAIMAQVLVQQYRAYELLRRQRQRIAESRNTLENTVRERTAELERTAGSLREEIDRHRRTEQDLRRAMSDREVLIREIHHRSKNNLQILSSLLNLARDRLQNTELESIITENQDRAHAMAAIHEQLYQADSLADVDFEGYVRQLAEHLSGIYAPENCDVDVELATEPVALPVDLAIPLGLLANEIITNSFKHAFVGRSTGVVRVQLEKADGGALLTLSDDGTGAEESLLEGRDGTLGAQLIRGLADQVGARLEVENDGGVTYRMAVPLAP